MIRGTHWLGGARSACLALALLAQTAQADQAESYDYFTANRTLIRHGVQAVLMCNGLFTSQRTLEQVFEQELAYVENPLGDPAGGPYEVEKNRRAVVVGDPASGLAVRAVFREGIGCVVMAPDQTPEEIADLPQINVPPPPADPATTAWPMGDVLSASGAGSVSDPAALAAASRWAFERESAEQVSLSLLVVHRGQIVHERYAPGFDVTTRTRTWSTAKSIAVTLIGMLVDQDRMQLDAPVGTDWLPDVAQPDDDPRDAITLRHLLNMSSGLYPVDSFGLEYATGSGLAYWAGASSVNGARHRGLVRAPGSVWEYENYDTLLAVDAMKRALGSTAAYHEFPRLALLDRIGMHNTLLSTDRFGDFILSSQVYTNARDLARFGLLYLNDGVWMGERLLSSEWIEFVRTPAPSTSERGRFYGGQWWLVPATRSDVPKDAYATAGNRGQYVIVVPSHDLVIVRRGLDFGKQGFDRWDLTREVLKAFERSE
ncbi:MAG: serine hydrolase domain-containing protein [Gammaproteobacteria bacterium]